MTSRSARAARGVDERLGLAQFARSALDKVFPDHFSFMLGEISLYCFLILVLTGTYLTLFFDASTAEVVYDGSYGPLQGQEVTKAYESVIRLSFDVRAGLVMRQMHHWAALLFLGAVVLHLMRIFFTGAYRKPREINWMVGVTLLVLAILNGFAGYSLLDDLLSGTGLRVGYSVLESIPLVGTWLAFWLFGGEFPGDQIISRLYIIHVLIIPGLIAGLLGVHLAILWRQKHTQFPGKGRTEGNVVGSRLFPTYAAKSISLLLAVFGVIALLGGLAQINPVWLYGPFEPAAVTTAAQPDWYVGWLEGALRIFPPWEFRSWGYNVPALFFPGVLVPGLTFAALYAWPFLERWATRDHDAHHLLDRPRFHPVRTAIGVGALTFFVVVFLAGSQDVIASYLDVSVNGLMWIFRIGSLVLPFVTAAIAWKWCTDLARATPGGDQTPPSPPAPEPDPVDRQPEREPEPVSAGGGG